jgi:poly [ADP-ribose] polymerase
VEEPAVTKKAPAKRGAAKKAKEEEEEEEKPEPKASKKRSASGLDEEGAPAPKKAAGAKTGPPAENGGSGGGGGGGGGARRPDRCVPGGSDLKVYQDYDVKLMFTDIGSSAIGNNKFYIIQVLEGRGSFWSWNRWGRLGENGQNNLEQCPSPEAAIKLFEKKFQEKTKNKWADRAAFVRHMGKYQLVETEEEAAEGDGGSGDAALGRLSVAQIKRGQEVLEKVRGVLPTPSHPY